MLLRLTGGGFIPSSENSSAGVEMIRSSDLNWEDGVEVYFGRKLHQNVVAFLTTRARCVERTQRYSQSRCQRKFGLWNVIRTIAKVLTLLLWNGMEEDPKQHCKWIQKQTLCLHSDKSIMANKTNIDSHSYCNLEESACADWLCLVVSFLLLSHLREREREKGVPHLAAGDAIWSERRRRD